MNEKKASQTPELLSDPVSAEKWRRIREGLIEWGRRYPAVKNFVYDLLQVPGEPPFNPWPEDGDVLR